jgi:hypothetical protein
VALFSFFFLIQTRILNELIDLGFVIMFFVINENKLENFLSHKTEDFTDLNVMYNFLVMRSLII